MRVENRDIGTSPKQGKFRAWFNFFYIWVLLLFGRGRKKYMDFCQKLSVEFNKPVLRLHMIRLEKLLQMLIGGIAIGM